MMTESLQYIAATINIAVLKPGSCGNRFAVVFEVLGTNGFGKPMMNGIDILQGEYNEVSCFGPLETDLRSC